MGHWLAQSNDERSGYARLDVECSTVGKSITDGHFQPGAASCGTGSAAIVQAIGSNGFDERRAQSRTAKQCAQSACIDFGIVAQPQAGGIELVAEQSSCGAEQRGAHVGIVSAERIQSEQQASDGQWSQERRLIAPDFARTAACRTCAG